MNPRDEQLAELMSEYLDALATNPNAEPPRELSPQMIATGQQLNANLGAREPTPEFVAALGKQIKTSAAAMPPSQSRTGESKVGLRRWSFLGLGAALLVAIGAFVFISTRPAPASAEQVLAQASTVAYNLAATGVNSFELESTSEQIIIGDAQQPIAGMSNTTSNLAYEGPTRWRASSTTNSLGETLQALQVSDGATLWTYDAYNNIVLADVATGDGVPLPNVGSLDILKQDWSSCYSPTIVGEETIAARAAFKVELGENKCRSASMPMFEGTRTLWVDKETFFVLKDEFIGKDGKQNLGTYQVSKVLYNVDLPDTLFQYTPAPEARVMDNRPKPAPTEQEYAVQLQELAGRMDYPLFVPNLNPTGLVPRVPQLDAVENSVKLEYVPPAEASTNTLADSSGVVIRQLRATYETVRNWTNGAQPIEIDGVEAWMRGGDFDPQLNVGANSAVMLVRDGTLVSLSSFVFKPDQLIAIAKTLEPVPGGHAPLPNPTPPSLAEIRAALGSPFFVPTYVPEGLTAEPPTQTQVQYHRADGRVALIVQNAKVGEGGMEQDPRFAGELITLQNGLQAHLLGFEPGILILWWHQDDGYISLEGHDLAKDELLKIAASMSATAELGPTEPPPARPTPTPVPPPSFAILRPTWFPEEMTVIERHVVAPDGTTPGVEIHFDPRPGSAPHDTLTLTEFPQGSADASVDDPQAITQDIGGRRVNIIKRGEGCVTYVWEQNGLVLTLTNPYDPPGEPGQVRYTCEQMGQVIESIR